MGGHYKTNLAKRTEPVKPQTQPGQGLSPPVLPPTATTPHVPPPRATTQPGAPGTTAGGQNPQVENGPVGQRPPLPGSNSKLPSTGAAGNGATPTPPAQLPTGQGQPGSLKPGAQGTATGPGSPSPTGVKPDEKKGKTEKPGGAFEEGQNSPPQTNGKSKPKATGSTDLPGALPPSGGISANGVPTGVAPVPSPPGLGALNLPASTSLGVDTSIVLGGVSSTVPSVPGNIRPTATSLAGPPDSQGLRSPVGGSSPQFVVDPLGTPLSKTVGTLPGQISPLANPAVQNPSLPGSVNPTLTQPLGATGNQPPAPQQVPALARRQQVNGLNPEKTSTTSTSTSSKPQKTKPIEPKSKEGDGVPELRYELAGDRADGKPETVGVSGSSSRISSSTTRTPTPPPVTNNGQPAPQPARGAQFYNPTVWVPPQLLYESVGGMIDTPAFYPNIYPPPNPGPVVMVNENTRTTTSPTATSTSPPTPSRSGPILSHESIDTQDPDAAVVKAAPPSHDPPSKSRSRDSTLGPSSTPRKVRRHGSMPGSSHTDSHSQDPADLPLYENVGSTPEKPAAIGPADSGSTATSSSDFTRTPPSKNPPPNTGTQSRNPGLLYESSGDGKDPVALPVIADVSRTTSSATRGSSHGPELRYEYGPGDDYPGAGIPAPILPTETWPTGGGPALKSEYAGAENQQPNAHILTVTTTVFQQQPTLPPRRSKVHISTVTTTVYQPQPTLSPLALKHEHAGAQNLVASPPTSTTTVTKTLFTTPVPSRTGQPGLLYEYANNADPSLTDVQSTTTTTPTSATPTLQGKQPPPKPLTLRHENAGQGATDTGDTPTPTEGPSSHLPGQYGKRQEQGSSEKKAPWPMHEAAADPVPLDPPNPANIIESDGTHPRKKRKYVRHV